MSAPTPYDVAHLASSAILSTMKPIDGSPTGSLKSGPGEWFDRDVENDPGYHYMRAHRHLASAWLNDDEKESDRDHLCRALTRIAFCIAILDDQNARKGA